MSSKYRSLSGVALMLLVIPIFAGLLACMPVPIGDPERSKIDPEMTGIWAILADSDFVYDAGFYVFEPYDKRTWLIAGISIQEGALADVEKYDFSTYAGYENLAKNESVSPDQYHAVDVALYKAWLTKLGGEWFLTWEPKGKVDALSEDPDEWVVFHVNKEGNNSLTLRMVNADSDPFHEIEETRRAFERVLKKHSKNPEIYGGPGDEFRLPLVRAVGPVRSFLEQIADLVIED